MMAITAAAIIPPQGITANFTAQERNQLKMLNKAWWKELMDCLMKTVQQNQRKNSHQKIFSHGQPQHCVFIL